MDNGPTPATPTLAQLVARVESNGNPDALRFEPATYAEADTRHAGAAALAKRVHACSSPTAGMIVSTSWGAYQCMGFNLYHPESPARALTIGDFLSSATAQRAAFEWLVGTFSKPGFFTYEALRNVTNRNIFARYWNGPGNIEAYSQRLADVMALMDAGK